MKFWVERQSSEEWAQYSEPAHLIVFGESKPKDMDRIDFALLIRNDASPQLMGYATCREWDRDSLYWQYGGAFPGTKSSSLTFRGYQAVLDYTRANYKRVSTLIENTNVVMLKFAAKVGFKIIGIRTIYGKIYLEHHMEFENAEI